MRMCPLGNAFSDPIVTEQRYYGKMEWEESVECSISRVGKLKQSFSVSYL